MKKDSYEVLRALPSPPVSSEDIGNSFDQISENGTESPLKGPFLSGDRFQESPQVENAVYGGLFATILLSGLGWLVISSREIILGLSASSYFIGNGMIGALHALQFTS